MVKKLFYRINEGNDEYTGRINEEYDYRKKTDDENLSKSRYLSYLSQPFKKILSYFLPNYFD